MEIFCKFFPTFQTLFFSTFFQQKIRILENCAHLFILNYNWANFQRNRRKKKIFQNFKNLIWFFSDLFLQNHKTRKLRNLTFHVLHVCQVSAEQKKWPLHVGIFEPKFPKFHHNFPNFQLETWVFLIFQKKSANFRKLRNLTYIKPQLGQFSEKSENLFFSSSSSSSFIHSFIHSFIPNRGGRSR